MNWVDREITQDVSFRVEARPAGGAAMVIEQDDEGKKSQLVTLSLDNVTARKLYRELGEALGHGPHPMSKATTY